METMTQDELAQAMVIAPVQLADWLVIAPVTLPLMMGALLVMLRRRPATQMPIALAGLVLLVALEAALLAHVVANGPVVMTMGRWLPPFGITFVGDVLGAVLVLTSGVVGLACGIFSIATVNVAARRYGFYTFMSLMLAGVAGSFLTGDIFNLYVWFEVFLISSFGLIVLGSGRRQIDGATKYAVLNLVATTLFLIATGYLYGIFGTLNMADIARKAPALRDSAPLVTLAMLYLVAFGMKAAAFPLSFWLPASYHTPRIVVSALFGGLLTKIGVYALLRTLLTIFPPERALFSDLIAWIAGATMIVGVLGALSQSDIRRIFGFLVVAGIGLMLAGLALGDPLGLAGTIVYAVNSMLIMAALYLLAGLMRRAGGSYSLHDLAGIYRTHPWLAAMALLLCFAAAGLPPGSGLWPKVMLVQSSLALGAWGLALAILANGLLTMLVLLRAFSLAFWREVPAAGALPDGGSEAPRPQMSGHVALALLCLPIAVLGVWPEPLIAVADAAATALLDPAGYVFHVFPEGAGP